MLVKMCEEIFGDKMLKIGFDKSRFRFQERSNTSRCFLDNIKKLIDKCCGSFAMYLDLQNSFDTVDQEKTGNAARRSGHKRNLR